MNNGLGVFSQSAVSGHCNGRHNKHETTTETIKIYTTSIKEATWNQFGASLDLTDRQMESEIIKYISGYIPVSKELEEAIIESKFIKFFNKGTFLIEEGKISDECFFILKGCVRAYYMKDGEEKTTEFYTEQQAIPSNLSSKKDVSNYFLECVEETIAAVSNPKLEAEMYQNFPSLESLSRIMNEAVMVKYVETFAEFKMASPEERYLNFLKTRANLIQRVPQHQIASYLGIKPESLSRIRKRITNN